MISNLLMAFKLIELVFFLLWKAWFMTHYTSSMKGSSFYVMEVNYDFYLQAWKLDESTFFFSSDLLTVCSITIWRKWGRLVAYFSASDSPPYLALLSYSYVIFPFLFRNSLWFSLSLSAEVKVYFGSMNSQSSLNSSELS